MQALEKSAVEASVGFPTMMLNCFLCNAVYAKRQGWNELPGSPSIAKHCHSQGTNDTEADTEGKRLKPAIQIFLLRENIIKGRR